MVLVDDIDVKFSRLVEIMALLRSEKGCPWDRDQTFASLRQHLLEEAYEVMESIDDGKFDELPGELGDLLLQIVFQAQIAAEEDLFDIGDVIDSITEKLIRRHPHVFGDKQIDSTEEQIIHWERSKVKKEGKKSAIDGIPKLLPALVRSYRMQNKAATVGFDWSDIEPVWEKVEEEWSELREAAESGNREKVEDELGDLLFSIVNLSRFLKTNPEDALRKTIGKFDRRFREVESEFRQRNRSMTDVSLAEMDEVWDRVKKKEIS